MIWRFEGGPWDGRELQLGRDDLGVPFRQVVEPLTGPPTTYELARHEEPATFVYRPVDRYT